MRELLAVAIGGSIGASLRWLVVSSLGKMYPSAFPWGTFAVNTLGSLCLGFLSVYLLDRVNVSSEVRLALMVGLLGSFTTFSTFALDAYRLIEAHAYGLFMLYISGQFLLSLAFVVLGIFLANNYT
ncbi:MAG: fluoride efflux transporter CrcB [Mariprofundaceae bacterium]|nr:fluoride efflux transporter CrcB [Mariprofundaceae bacterium]